MTIRKLTETDAPAIDAILRELQVFPYFEETPKEDTIHKIKQHIMMCLADDSHTMFVAENDNGTVVGYTSVHWIPYLMLSGPDGYVSELFVAASEREQRHWCATA
jgi:predicted N-acetyltransferase YhbS